MPAPLRIRVGLLALVAAFALGACQPAEEEDPGTPGEAETPPAETPPAEVPEEEATPPTEDEEVS